MPPARGPLVGMDLPEGFDYQPDFLDAAEEASLTAEIARRRVAFFGRSYRTGGAAIAPLPSFLLPYRDRVAAWAGVSPEAFSMALINEYAPGAPIGWHRDAPQYDIVAGISLLSACRMKLRPYARPGSQPAGGAPRRTATHDVALERRSAYVMRGIARTGYEHHIPAVTAFRYSVTFRTLRD